MIAREYTYILYSIMTTKPNQQSSQKERRVKTLLVILLLIEFWEVIIRRKKMDRLSRDQKHQNPEPEIQQV